MIRVSLLNYNPIQVNTYIIAAENGSCIILDPGCMSEKEETHLAAFIEQEKLSPKAVWLTHLHLDHVYGAAFAAAKWSIPVFAGKNDSYLHGKAGEMASQWGLPSPKDFSVSQWIADGDVLTLEGESFEVREVPGHTSGSVVYYNAENKVCFCGDVLFRTSVGRSDLPGGDGNALIANIRQKLMTLPDDIVVCPGHGPTTTIGDERKLNPYLTLDI